MDESELSLSVQAKVRKVILLIGRLSAPTLSPAGPLPAFRGLTCQREIQAQRQMSGNQRAESPGA